MAELTEHDFEPTEERLARLLDAYRRERDDGGDPDPEALLRANPDVALELADCLFAMAALEELQGELCSDQASASATPRRIGDFEIVREIGQGGMGIVYEALDTRLNRRVALKRIKAGALADRRDLDMFRKEARAAASLHHPNIVELFEIGEHDGQPYLVLEFVAGGSLDAKLGVAPMTPAEAAHLLTAIARAIHHAHQQGIIHRDLKPGNVLLAIDRSQGTPQSGYVVPKVADFGLAKLLHAEEGQTQSKTIKGTPSYMAPEQVRGDGCDATTDVYALGAILYETLTGRPPFRAATPWDTLTQVASMEPVAPTRLQPGVPRDLETICLKCLRKEPPQRYSSAADLADDLQRFLRHEPIQARPIGAAGRLGRWVRRNPVVAALLGASISLACVVLVLLIVRLADQQSARERILAENLFAANHLANTILVELWKSAEAVEQAASDPELRRCLLEDRRRLRALPTGNDPASPRVELPETQRLLQPYLEEVQQRSQQAFHSWHVVDADGIMLADVPRPARSVFGVSFQGRDYFLGAMEHAGAMGRSRVHVSRAYQSSNDDLFKITLSAIVYGEDRTTPVGVVCATLPTGFLNIADAEHTAVLVGPIDANDPHLPPAPRHSSSEHMILVHPAYGERAEFHRGRNAVRMPSTALPFVPRRVAGRDEFVPEDRTVASAARSRLDAYEDPLGKVDPAKFAGRWLAGFAQVGNTDMIVIVQRRPAETDATWLGLMLTASALLVCASAAAWHLRKRRIALPHLASPRGAQAPTIDFTGSNP